jgi:hypothetical protein
VCFVGTSRTLGPLNITVFSLCAYEKDLETSSYEGKQIIIKIIDFTKCRRTWKSESYSGCTGLDSQSKDRISFDVGRGFAQCHLGNIV